MTVSFAPPTVLVPRDRRGRPLVAPPGGSVPVPYERASAFAGLLADERHTQLWRRRMTARGLAASPALLARVADCANDPKRLDRLCEQAADAAGAADGREWGDDFHKLAEQADKGEDPEVPEEFEADLAAYREETGGFEFHEVETFRVCDELRVAGTPDRVAIIDGRLVILDIKTGRVKPQAAMQLALYARSLRYDPATGERVPDPLPMELGWAVIAHVPKGKGRCSLRRVDIERGWEHCLTARDLLAARKRGLGQLTKPYTPGKTNEREKEPGCRSAIR